MLGSGSNLNSFIQTTFDKVDKHRYLIVDVWSGEMNSGEASTYAARYFWNGTEFAVKKNECKWRQVINRIQFGYVSQTAPIAGSPPHRVLD